MKTKLNVSIIVLLVLFATNLSCRYHSKSIRVLTTTESTIPEIDLEVVVYNTLPSPYNFLLALVQNFSTKSVTVLTFIDSDLVSNPTLNFLYLAHSPPTLS